MTVFIYDAETGATTERKMTDDETAERETLALEMEQQVLAQEAKAAARESALAKLAALGLTDEEIGAL
jgi:hypothetical protein